MEGPNDSCMADAPTEGHFIAQEESKTGLASSLESLHVPDLRVISGDGELALYSRDQADVPNFLRQLLLRPMPSAVVQPSTYSALPKVLAYARDHDLSVIPRGSASSPFGGSIPVNGGLVVDTSQLDKILIVDKERKYVTVQGGARWADIDHELGKSHLRLISSPSSKFSTVGGWVAGGGIGVGSLGAGPLIDNVLALKIATDRGIRSLYPSDEDFQAVFGSEGQLGIVVEVTLRVKDTDVHSRPHLFIFLTSSEAVQAAHRMRYLRDSPEDLIYFSAGKLAYANKLLGGTYFPSGHALLVTSSGKDSEKALSDLASEQGLHEESEFLARMLSHDRYFPMKLRRLGPGMLGAEVLAPNQGLGELLGLAESLCHDFALDPLLEVHFLQGRTSLLLCYYLTDQANGLGYTLDAVKSMVVTSALIQKGARPYSLGIWNNSFADRLPNEEKERLRTAKSRLDPAGMMNRGKYFHLSGRLYGLPSRLLAPGWSGAGLRVFAEFSKPLAPFLRLASGVTNKLCAGQDRKEHLSLIDQCAMCGACVSVCPAYLIVRDERVTARGKLQTMKALIEEREISKEHAQRTFLCMRCKACEQVCQSKLQLIPFYEALEKELEVRFARDEKEVERFVRFTELSPQYDALVDKGLVLGAPKHGMGGDNHV